MSTSTISKAPAAQDVSTSFEVSLKVGEANLPLREFTSKAGNTCYAVQAKKANGERYVSKYGVQLPQLVDSLPTVMVLTIVEHITTKEGVSSKTHTVKVDDLEAGFTTSEDPKVTPRNKVSRSGALDLPGLGRKSVILSISETKTGGNNVIAKIISVSEGGGGRVTSLDDL